MKKTDLFLGFFSLLSIAGALEADTSSPLQKLLEGNERFRVGRAQHQIHEWSEPKKYNRKSKPFALVLCCSDCAPAPERIFDQGSDDITVIRLGGNVVTPAVQEMIHYSITSSAIPLIFVLGHQNCSSMQIAAEGNREERKQIENFLPYLEEALYQSSVDKGERWENAVKSNVKQSMDNLLLDAEIAALVQDGTLTIVGGYYHPRTETVEIIRK